MAGLVDIEWAEGHANAMRRDIELSDTQDLDPYVLADAMEIKLLPISDIRNVPPEILSLLLVRDSRGWSAGSLCFPDGTVKVIMNPKHAPTRARATLMEELVHVHLAHKPSLLLPGADGIFIRTYDKRQEDEAYWVGAAALVTMWQLRRAQELRHTTVQSFARFAEVSVALVRFRCKITGIPLPEDPPGKGIRR